MPHLCRLIACLFALTCTTYAADLAIVEGGKTSATIVVSAQAGKWEKLAATELSRVITLMTGATVPVGQTPGTGPVIHVGT